MNTPLRRYKKVLIPRKRRWYHKLLGIKPTPKIMAIPVYPGQVGFEKAEYDEVVITSKEPIKECHGCKKKPC